MQSSCNSDSFDSVYVCGIFVAWDSRYCNTLATSPVSPTTDVSKVSSALWTHYLQYKVVVDVFFVLNTITTAFMLNICVWWFRITMYQARDLAPDYAMFGFPGIGHSKPTIHSPGVYLVLFVHHLIPSCLNSSWTPSTHVLARDLFFDAFVKQHQMIPILTRPTSAFLLQCSVNTINTCSYLRLYLKLL